MRAILDCSDINSRLAEEFITRKFCVTDVFQDVQQLFNSRCIWLVSPDERVIAGSHRPNGSESRSKPFHKNSAHRIDS